MWPNRFTTYFTYKSETYMNILILLPLKVSECVQRIPQSQTADQPTAPWGRATGHLQ